MPDLLFALVFLNLQSLCLVTSLQRLCKRLSLIIIAIVLSEIELDIKNLRKMQSIFDCKKNAFLYNF